MEIFRSNRYVLYDEYRLYMQTSVGNITDNPLPFWKKNAARFLTFSTIARLVLCCPIGSTESERLFIFGRRYEK